MILRFISAITFLFLPLWIGIATLGIYMISEKIKEFINEIQSDEPEVQGHKQFNKVRNAQTKSVSGRHSLPARFTADRNI